MSSIFRITRQLAVRKAEVVYAQEMRSSLQTIKRRLIKGVRSKMREDSGAEKRNVKGKVTGSLFRLRLEVYGDLVQTAVDETGRDAGKKAPPSEALIPWVKRKINPEPSKVESVAFLVARKIARDGIPANKPFERTENESERDVLNELNKGVERGTARLNR